jgi:lysophospholipase L1-like esterase
VFNYGVPGERIQNTLWRLDALDTSHLRPGWVVVLLGTNNLGDGDLPGEIASGLERVIEATSRLWHAPHHVVLTIPPRGIPRFREADRQTANELLAERYMMESRFTLLDTDSALGRSLNDGSAFESDHLHINQSGYALLSIAVNRVLHGAGDEGPNRRS